MLAHFLARASDGDDLGRDEAEPYDGGFEQRWRAMLPDGLAVSGEDLLHFARVAAEKSAAQLQLCSRKKLQIPQL